MNAKIRIVVQYAARSGAAFFGKRILVMEILVNSQEASLLNNAFRRLPPDAAIELSRLVERLAALAPDRKIDWSDSWSDEDLREFRAASIRRFEASESSRVLV